MKRTIYLLLFLVAGWISTAATVDEKCDTRALKKEGIANLNPYYYSAAKINLVNYDYKASRKEIEVPLFKGEKYKLVFNKKGLPKDVVIEIYDKDKEHAGRTPLFTSEGNVDPIVSYEPQKSKKLYVNYIIPKSDGEKEEGCLVFILGYQLTFID